MENTVQKIVGGQVAIAENLNDFIRTQGVVVSVTVGGGRNSYYISPKIYGVVKEELSTDSNEFLNEHIRDGRISLLKVEEEKAVRKIEARVKKRLKEMSIGYGNSFIPTSYFSEFKEYFEENREAFFAYRDSLVENYDSMVTAFGYAARAALKDMGAKAGEKELESILSRLPSKNEFSASFRMDMNVSAFPTVENMDMFDGSIQDVIRNGVNQSGEDLLLDSVVSTMNEAVTTLSSVIRSLKENGKLHSRVVLGLKNGVVRMAQCNLAGNEKMDGLRVEMLGMLTQEPDEASNTAEFILFKLYQYSKELRVDDRLDFKKCPLTEAEIEDLSDIYG